MGDNEELIKKILWWRLCIQKGGGGVVWTYVVYNIIEEMRRTEKSVCVGLIIYYLKKISMEGLERKYVDIHI